MSKNGHDTLDAMYTHKLKERIGASWASIIRCQDGDRYDTINLPTGNPKEHPYIKILDKYIPDKNFKILEIGAGDGSETRMFLDYGYKNITGITIGKENCERGKNIYNVDLLYMDMHFTSFPNESFDAIIGFQAYEHTPSPLLLGLEFNRLLRLGGKIVMEVARGEEHFAYEGNPHHLNVVEPWQGKNMLRRCGFINVEASDEFGERNVLYGEKGNKDYCDNHFYELINGKFMQP